MDMRRVAHAIEAYRLDHGRYPAVSIEGGVVDLHRVADHLEYPFGKGALPTRDAWGANFLYIAGPDAATFSLVSGGKNRRTEGPGGHGPTEEPEADIWYTGGSLHGFTQFPAGGAHPRDTD